MGWKILLLIPKDDTYNRGIGLLELLWKVVEVIIDTRLRASFHLHSFLHGFCIGKGIGTEILEMNLAQELASVDQDPILLSLLDMCKA